VWLGRVCLGLECWARLDAPFVALLAPRVGQVPCHAGGVWLGWNLARRTAKTPLDVINMKAVLNFF
jgi:hypothetical protein